jgi:hypothetical protein
MKKTVVLYVIGRKPLEEGMRILGAHIDSPRLDLKQHPLYEDTELAFLDTTTTAASRSTSGRPFRWRFTASSRRRTAVS